MTEQATVERQVKSE